MVRLKLGRWSQSRLHLNKAIGDGAARVSRLGDDGNLAGVDTVLSATMEFGMQRIKDVG